MNANFRIFRLLLACATLLLSAAFTARAGSTTAPAAPAYPFALDADGWSVVPAPAAGSVQLCVSSSTGNDASAGTQAAPLKTIARAMKLVRPGKPDWIHLMDGDNFNEPVVGPLAGSPGAYAGITSYGDAAKGRPHIIVQGRGSLFLGGSYLAVIDIDFNAGRDPSQPGFILRTSGGGGCLFNGSNILYEGNSNEWAIINLTVQPAGTTPLSGVIIRRNIIVNAYSGGAAFSQGIYTNGLLNPLIEQNFIHGNGWNPKVFLGTNSMFNHGYYCSWDFGADNAIIRQNIFSNNCSSGLQQRCGGICHDNLFLNNGTAEDWTGEGNYCGVDYNVSTTSADCPSTIGPGTTTFYTGGGFQYNAFSGYLSNNIVCHGKPTASFAAYCIARNNRDNNTAIPATDLVTVANNVTYDYWFDSLQYVDNERPQLIFTGNLTAKCQRKSTNFSPHPFPPATTLLGKITLSANTYDTDGKFFWQGVGMSLAAWTTAMKGTGEKIASPAFVDPTRTIESYIAANKLGASYNDFVTLWQSQRRGHWNTALLAYSVNDYFRAGFAVK